MCVCFFVLFFICFFVGFIFLGVCVVVGFFYLLFFFFLIFFFGGRGLKGKEFHNRNSPHSPPTF